jgi:predicted acylesterase/phospholipase RssA
MSAISSLRGLTEAMGGLEVCDTFDMIVGTSTGAIIAFLVGLRRETSQQANDRYDVLIERIFGKTTFRLSTLFTTATYSELPFAEILYDILGDSIMLDSRANPAVPLVFGVSSVMTSTPTYVTLFRNYNYAGGELPDHFVLDPDEARRTLGLKAEFKERAPKSEWRAKFDYTTFMTGEKLTKEGSRYYGKHLSNRDSSAPLESRSDLFDLSTGSFRPLQREALRKSTAAPTIFKPVKVKDVLYCDGGIVASNPTAIAIHEARTLFPDIPIELVVSIGTGGFTEERFSPKFGWDAIIGQIVNSACDAERIHHVLEDMIDLGAGKQGMKYYRFNPVVGAPNEFPIDSKDPELLARLYDITTEYLEEPEQRRKLKEILDILVGKRGWRKFIPWLR